MKNKGSLRSVIPSQIILLMVLIREYPQLSVDEKWYRSKVFDMSFLKCMWTMLPNPKVHEIIAAENNKNKIYNNI